MLRVAAQRLGLHVGRSTRTTVARYRSSSAEDGGYVTSAGNRLVTVAVGDGIGPEIMAATLRVLDASGAKLEYEHIDIGMFLLKSNNMFHWFLLLFVPAAFLSFGLGTMCTRSHAWSPTGLRGTQP